MGMINYHSDMIRLYIYNLTICYWLIIMVYLSMICWYRLGNKMCVNCECVVTKENVCVFKCCVDSFELVKVQSFMKNVIFMLLVVNWLILLHKQHPVMFVPFINPDLNGSEIIVHNLSSSSRSHFQTECGHWNGIASTESVMLS